MWVGIGVNLEADRVAGAGVYRVCGGGGVSRCALWRRVLAWVLDVPVDLPADGDFGVAFWAARLGLNAATGASYLDVCTPPRIAKTFKPDARTGEAYARAYERYVKIYPAIKEIKLS